MARCAQLRGYGRAQLREYVGRWTCLREQSELLRWLRSGWVMSGRGWSGWVGLGSLLDQLPMDPHWYDEAVDHDALSWYGGKGVAWDDARNGHDVGLFTQACA